MGFCFGVRRAVEMMQEEARTGLPIASLGSVVHNPQVVGRLREQGVDVVKALDDIGSRRVAITAHGVGPTVLEQAETLGLEVVDTTCPIVTRAQQWAKRLLESGFAVIVFGDPDHKEVRGILGWARGKAITLRDESEIDTLPDDLPSKIGVLAQTTHTEARFASFVNRLLQQRMHRISELRVINTLCNATTGQQAAALELAQQVDAMVVVGGRESANTRHLAEICVGEGLPTHHIESATEIDPSWFSEDMTVGVTAGASTPDFVIDEVVARLERLDPPAPPPARGTPKPLVRNVARPLAPSADRPTGLTDDERDRLARWRDATDETRGRVTAELLEMVDALPSVPPKHSMFPGWLNIKGHAGDTR
jgi:4-hydroxy-3-methylbut-2-enyl diphosphate reductase